MTRMSEIRCFWFEDDGTPIRKQGCPKGSTCGFSHPTDKDWDLLPKQKRRPSGYESRRDSGGNGWRSGSPRRSDRLSRSRSPPVHRSTREDKEKHEDSHSRHRKDSIASSSSRRSNASLMPSTMAIPTSTPLASNLNKTRNPPPSSPRKMLLDPPAIITSKSPTGQSFGQVPGLRLGAENNKPSTSMPARPSVPPPPPPPPPETSTPMPPPYPLPAIPKGLILEVPTPVPEPTTAQKRQIWETRINLFADAYQAKRDLERYEQMYKSASDISQTNYFSTSFSEDDRGRYNADLAELLVKRDEAKKVHDDAFEKLIENGTWPLAPPPSTKSDEQEEQDRRDILRHVHELNDTAQKMSKILGDIAMQTKPPILPLPTDDDDDDFYVDDAMNLDDDNPPPAASASLPSRKRQRVSDAGDAVPRPPDRVLPTREDLEGFVSQLEKLDGRILDLDNELVSYERDIKQSFEHEIEKRLEDYHVARKQKENAKRQAREEEMKRVSADAEDLGNDVREVGNEVADAIARIEKLKIQLVDETKQRDLMQAKVVEVNERLQSYVQEREASQQKIQTLEAALKAYQSSASRPSPPCTPSGDSVAPTSDYILSQLQEPLLEVIRQHIQPILTQTRTETEALVKEKNMEIVNKVWPRMELVSRLLGNVVDKWESANNRQQAAAVAVGGRPLQVSTSVSASGGLPLTPAPTAVHTQTQFATLQQVPGHVGLPLQRLPIQHEANLPHFSSWSGQG